MLLLADVPPLLVCKSSNGARPPFVRQHNSAAKRHSNASCRAAGLLLAGGPPLLVRAHMLEQRSQTRHDLYMDSQLLKNV